MTKHQKVTLWLETEELDLIWKNLTPQLQNLLSKEKVKMARIEYDLIDEKGDDCGKRWVWDRPAVFSGS